MADEIKIINRCLKGNRQAFETLVDRYKSLVCSLAYCATGNIDTSQDIAQEVFIAIWKNLHSVKDHAKLKPWIISVTRNTINYQIRKESTSPKTLHVDMQEINPAADSSYDPSLSIIKGEENAMLWETLEAMPLEYREALVLYYRHDKSTKQVAALLNISHDLARQRLSRGRDMLKDQIERRLEAGIKNSGPGKKFTASVITAISALPVGVAISEAAVSTAAATGGTSILSLTAGKIAALLLTVTAITTGIVIGYNKKTAAHEPLTSAPVAITQPENFPTHVETHGSASDITTPTNNIPNPTTPEPQTTKPQYLASQIAKMPAQPEGFVPKGVLSGLITDIKTGEPVIDATVTVYMQNKKTQTHVDENGFYYFEYFDNYGTCGLSVDTDEYVGLRHYYNNTISLPLSPETQSVQHIQLEKACMLEIETVNEEGFPVENVDIIVTDPTIERPYDICSNTQLTDSNGVFSTGGIKPSKKPYMISIVQRDPNDLWMAVNYVPQMQLITLDDPEVIRSIHVVMRKGVTISGRLLYADGHPASDMRICAEPTWWNSTFCCGYHNINDDGTFKMQIDPGEHKILGYKDIRIKTINVLSINEGDFLELVLPEKSPANLARFTGKVIIDGDCDIRSIAIKVFSDNYEQVFDNRIEIEEGNTQREFEFELDGIPPGIYNATFSGSHLTFERVNNISIPADSFKQTVYCLDRTTINGTIIDEDNKQPIKNCRILPKIVKAHGQGYKPVYSTWINCQNNTGNQFEMNIELPGIYELLIDADDYAPKAIQLDTIETPTFTAELSKGKTLSGKITNAQGQAISNVKLIPLSKNAETYSCGAAKFIKETIFATTDSNGCFTLNNIPEYPETIKIKHPDYAEKVIIIESDNLTSYRKIILDEGGSIEGYAYDNDGKPMTNLTLAIVKDESVDSPMSEPLKVVTDENGYYKFEHLTPTLWYVTNPLSTNAEGVYLRGVYVPNAQKTNLNMGGTAFLTGRIINDGKPLGNVKIRIYGPANEKKWMFCSQTISKPDGSFCFSGIPEGSKELILDIDYEQERTETITEFDTQGKNLDLGDILVSHEPISK